MIFLDLFLRLHHDIIINYVSKRINLHSICPTYINCHTTDARNSSLLKIVLFCILTSRNGPGKMQRIINSTMPVLLFYEISGISKAIIII